MAAQVQAIRPLTLGEILDRTVQLYRRNFRLLIGIAALPAAIDVLVSGGAAILLSSRIAGLTPAKPGAPMNLPAAMTFFLIAAAFGLIGLPLLLAVFSVALNALNFAALALNRGRQVTVGESYRFAMQKFWRGAGILSLQFLLAAAAPGAVFGGVFMVLAVVAAVILPKGANPALALTVGLATFGLILAVAGVCVWIWIRFCLAFPASVEEACKAWPAMKRSGQLTKGTRGRIFVMYLMVGTLTMVVYYALIIPLDLMMGMRIDKLFAVTHTAGMVPVLVQTVNLFISFLERAFVMPIYATALMLFYADQRTRLEGYDIEHLMSQAGWSELPSLPPPSLPPPVPSPVFHQPVSLPVVFVPEAVVSDEGFAFGLVSPGEEETKHLQELSERPPVEAQVNPIPLDPNPSDPNHLVSTEKEPESGS